jgi:hypothetical protein
MLKIRTIVMAVLLTSAVAVGSYFAVLAVPAAAKSTTAGSVSSCPVVHSATALSEQDLWRILNGRYERRVRLPY